MPAPRTSANYVVDLDPYPCLISYYLLFYRVDTSSVPVKMESALLILMTDFTNYSYAVTN